MYFRKHFDLLYILFLSTFLEETRDYGKLKNCLQPGQDIGLGLRINITAILISFYFKTKEKLFGLILDIKREKSKKLSHTMNECTLGYAMRRKLVLISFYSWLWNTIKALKREVGPNRRWYIPIVTLIKL